MILCVIYLCNIWMNRTMALFWMLLIITQYWWFLICPIPAYLDTFCFYLYLSFSFFFFISPVCFCPRLLSCRSQPALPGPERSPYPASASSSSSWWPPSCLWCVVLTVRGEETRGERWAMEARGGGRKGWSSKTLQGEKSTGRKRKKEGGRDGGVKEGRNGSPNSARDRGRVFITGGDILLLLI